MSSGSLFKKTTIPTNERKWIVIDANPSHEGALAIEVSKLVSRMVHHCDQEEREQDGSYHWDTVESVLLRRLGNMEHKNSQKILDTHHISVALLENLSLRNECHTVVFVFLQIIGLIARTCSVFESGESFADPAGSVKENSADVGTKSLSEKEMRAVLERLSMKHTMRMTKA